MKEVESILENTMHDIIIDAIKEVDIKGIMVKQITDITQNIARDIFSNYGDFQKELKEKIAKELSFNIDTISVPEFGKLAIDSVQAELLKIEEKESQNLQKQLTSRLANLLGTKDTPILLKDLCDKFAMSVYEEHVKYKLNSCQDYDVTDLESLNELIENNSDHELEFTIQERQRNWGSEWKAYSVAMLFEYKYKDKIVYAINLIVDRQRDTETNESHWDDDRWRSTSKNLYIIKDVEINGKSITTDGSIYLKGLREDVEQLVGGCLLNETLVDANNLYYFEIDQD